MAGITVHLEIAMQGLRHISGFIVLVAFFVGSAGCSDDQVQHGASSAVSSAPEGEVVEIPLDQIWAWRMPGTRDILELQSDQLSEESTPLASHEQRHFIEHRLWSPIVMSLMSNSPDWPREGQVARPGFAVLGTGLEALRNAYSVLVEGERLRKSFPVGSDITLVFFSYQFGAYVHLQKVERRENVIEVQYRFARPLDMISSVQVALIPMKHLPVGKYQVEIKEMPPVRESPRGGYESLPPHLRDRWKAEKWGDRFVCRAFSFRIVEDAEN